MKKRGLYLVLLAFISIILFAGRLKMRGNVPVASLPPVVNQGSGAGNQGEQQQYIAVTVLPPAPKPASAAKKQKATERPAKGKSMDMKTPSASAGKHDGEGSGGDPNFYAEYELGINDYLAFMRGRGAKVLIYDLSTNTQVCEVTATGKLREVESLDGYSSNMRRLTDDYPDAGKLFKQVEKKFGRSGNYEILLALPESMVDAMNTQVKRIVGSSGLRLSEVSTVFLRYRGNRTSVIVEVNRVSGKMGSRIINKSFRL